MTRKCRECDRLNPAEAAFCFHDGTPLGNGAAAGEGSSIDFSTWAFPRPFVFPSGDKCHNFFQLALACYRHRAESIDVLQRGFLESFFASMGRVDLAMAAHAAARVPDGDRALDELLGKLPASPLGPPKLSVEPPEKNFGVLQVGDDRTFELTLTNGGERLVYGKVSVEGCPWLAVGEGRTPEKIFQFYDRASIPVTVRGRSLRAYTKPQKAEIAVESNAGDFVVTVQVLVPVRPFAEGVLSGATSPRQVAEKAKAHPREAAALLESGAVARWYEANGWDYPVQGPTASGIAAVQQFFEVLGLVKPPRVELTEPAVTLGGRPGERVEYVLTVLTQEKRAAVAHGVSDQPWLLVGRPVFRGQMATIPLTVESVPDQPGQALTARVKVTANGGQRFDVPVTLNVAGTPVGAPAPLPLAAASAPTALPTATVVAEDEALPQPVPIEDTLPAPPPPPVLDFSPPPAAVPVPAPLSPPAAVPAAGGVSAGGRRKQLLARLLPVGIVVLGLMAAVGRDLLFREPVEEPLPEVDYDNPVLAVQFHDQSPVAPGDFVSPASMRFGLGARDPKDPTRFRTKITYDEYGRTCNVCVRIDKGLEFLLGDRLYGDWKEPMRGSLGRDQAGHKLEGAKSVWACKPPLAVSITQYVEIVPGGLSADGKKRLLDTCLVRYDITNNDAAPHSVALRFLLDTFIGGNDAVPFTIASDKKLCDTMKSFKAGEVPDYISALERQDLKNPGTVAHLSLKYGGSLEAPTRVTLGAWPAPSLRKEPGGEKADKQDTGWEVPVLPMALAKSAQNPTGDSAVTMYWDDRELAPKQTRTVGFAYGLGSVAGEKGGGELGITAGGEVVAEKEFTLTAYVKNPAPGTTITLTLPKGLRLAPGSEARAEVPPVPGGAASPYSPVTWRVQAARGGVHRVKVTLSTGATLTHRLGVEKARKLLD